MTPAEAEHARTMYDPAKVSGFISAAVGEAKARGMNLLELATACRLLAGAAGRSAGAQR